MILDEIQNPKTEILDKLREDKHYYGTFGRNYLSNSDIGALLNNPLQFRKDKEATAAMMLGRYFHTELLEPQKLKDFKIVDASTRNTKKYKELGEPGLLSKEVDMLSAMAKAIRMNLVFYDMIYEPGNQFEQPAIAEIAGQQWKGKADIIGSEYIIDLKTTSVIEDFKYSARKYNYDSQAWLYQQLFGKPLVFIVVEKHSCKTGLFDCSEDFLEYGKQKVFKAIEVYEKFFGKNPTEDITQYFINQTL